MNLRELDEIIAEQVMGWKKEIISSFWGADPYKTWYPPKSDSIIHEVPYYSKYMEYAWEVVNELVKQGLRVKIDKTPDGYCRCIVQDLDNFVLVEDINRNPALAICRAAIKRVGTINLEDNNA